MSADLIITVLLIIGLAFMALEAFAPSFGLLGLAGAVSFFAALGLLHDTGLYYGVAIDTPAIVALGLIGLAVLTASFYFVLKARKSRIAAGAETMIGMPARVTAWSGETGQVHVDGESWAARGSGGIVPGDTVTVVSRDNLILNVSKEA